MCIDFWRQTAGPTVVTNAANVCRRLMRNGWWQCCTQVASLIGETLPSTVTSIIIICRKVDANTLCYRPPSPPLSWKSRHWYQRPYWMQWGRVVVLLRQRYVWRKGLHSLSVGRRIVALLWWAEKVVKLKIFHRLSFRGRLSYPRLFSWGTQ